MGSMQRDTTAAQLRRPFCVPVWGCLVSDLHEQCLNEDEQLALLESMRGVISLYSLVGGVKRAGATFAVTMHIDWKLDDGSELTTTFKDNHSVTYLHVSRRHDGRMDFRNSVADTVSIADFAAMFGDRLRGAI